STAACAGGAGAAPGAGVAAGAAAAGALSAGCGATGDVAAGRSVLVEGGEPPDSAAQGQPEKARVMIDATWMARTNGLAVCDPIRALWLVTFMSSSHRAPRSRQ